MTIDGWPVTATFTSVITKLVQLTDRNGKCLDVRNRDWTVNNVVQIIVTTISYVVWVYTLGGPFSVWGIYSPAAGSVFLVIWTLAMPLLVPPAPNAPPSPSAAAS